MNSRSRPKVIDGSPRASLVIPCFNEAGNVLTLWQKLTELLDPNARIEIVLVDNGSSDGTRELLRRVSSGQHNVTVVELDNNLGYGGGIKAGLRVARGDILGWSHADLQADPSDFLRGVALVEERGVSFVKGFRVRRPWFDKFFSLGTSVFASLVFAELLRDINAQPTIYRDSRFHSLLADGPDDFSFDLFAIVMARKLRLTETRFKVFFANRLHGESAWNTSPRSRWKMVFRTATFCLVLRRSLARQC